jgi:hypothetical protein
MRTGRRRRHSWRESGGIDGGSVGVNEGASELLAVDRDDTTANQVLEMTGAKGLIAIVNASAFSATARAMKRPT